jgi:hypothetical protein
MGVMRTAYNVLVRKINKRDYKEGQVYMKILLKWISK